ncbi:MAG: 4Fe-4S dicluster domain-containing protein [Ruminococcaceae bacterium]|nr:4Fe-4S dicluster domain-containing protein [Oscillospiraceae bacterium]
MAYFINDDCISCGSCASVCPLGIIEAGDSKYVIDAEQCVECGTCADACPMGAISQQ